MRKAFQFAGTTLVGLLAGLVSYSMGIVDAGAQAQRQPGRPAAPNASQEYPVASVSGVTRYNVDELWKFAVAHAARGQGTTSIQSIARTIELIYREDGYFLAEVSIRLDSDRRTAELVVSEGHVAEIEINGVDPRLSAKIRSYVERAITAGPIRQADFERAITLAGDLSGVTVRAVFDASGGHGGIRLTIIASAIDGRGGVTIDNPPRGFGRTISGIASHEFYSSLEAGDLLRFYVGANKSLASSGFGIYGGVYYRVPVGGFGTYAEAFAGNVLARREISGALDTTQEVGRSVVLLLGHPVVRDVHQFLYALAEYDYAESHSRGDLGRFHNGAHTMRGTLAYGYTANSGAPTRARLTFSGGHAVGDSVSRAAQDNVFWHVRAGFGTIQPLDFLVPALAFRFESFAQLSSGSLPLVEKFYIGDRRRLRGYGFAEVDGDSGVSATFEVSRHFAIESMGLQAVTPFVFFDVGFVANNRPAAGARPNWTLASIGAGVDIELANRFSLRSWIGLPLRDGALAKRYSPAVLVGVSKGW